MHDDYRLFSLTIQWNRIPRVEHSGHQFHHGIGLHAPVGVLQSHGQSLRFCAYRLVADRKDTNVAEAIDYWLRSRYWCTLADQDAVGEAVMTTTGKRWSPRTFSQLNRPLSI
ncbi:hypothetical protein T05_13006 [Trichinella murrelli]|uniref:Uncharacterized protein n=1 Tax=Trichinella murrelli TaxID=144512 RepID=A0A0V0TPH3_9BILA|nr:hypothetical protein T05_13006 [Trichinella murrelli]